MVEQLSRRLSQPLSRVPAWAWLLVPGVVVVAPLWFARYLPFADMPEHAAVSAALAHWDDPAWRIPEYFAFAPLSTPYWLYDFVGALVARVVGDAFTAHVVLLTLVGLSLPWSAAAFLESLGRDRRLGALAAALFWNRALQYGLLPFMASIPVLLYGLAGYIEFLRRRSTGRASRGALTLLFARACAAALLLPFLHITTFAVYWLVAAGYALVWWRHSGGPGGLRKVLPLLPLLSAGIVLAYALGATRTGGFEGDLRFLSARTTLASIPEWSFNVWRRRDEKVFAVVYWIGYLGVFVSGFRRRTRFVFVRIWPLLVAAVIFAAVPFQIGAGMMLNIRVGPLLWVMLLPLLRLRASRLARGSVVATLLGTLGQALVARSVVLASQEDLGDFRSIVDGVPTGSRILYLPFDRRTPQAHFFPWMHVAAAIRAEKGGLSQFSFTVLPHWPLHDRVSPRKPGFWDRSPCWFEADTDGAFYDVLLVRGAFDPFQGTGDALRHPMGSEFVLTVAAPPFYLWRRQPAARLFPTPELEPAPCDTWGPSVRSGVRKLPPALPRSLR